MTDVFSVTREGGRRTRSARAIAYAVAFAALASIGACKGDDPVGPPAAGLQFSAPPAAVLIAGEPFTVTVQLLDSAGTPSTTATDPVTISVSGESVLSGPTGVRANRGIAKFEGLRLNKVDSNIVLTAILGDVSVASETFRVRPGAVSASTSSMPLSYLNVPQSEPISVVLTLRDANGNAVGGERVSLSSTLAEVTFSPDTGTSAADGTMPTTFLSSAAGMASMRATVAGSTITFPSTVTFCAIGALAFPGTVSGTVTGGTCMSNTRATASYKWTLATAGGAAFTATSGFLPHLEVRAFPATDNAVPPDTSLGHPIEWLLPAGTYQVRVSAAAEGGAFSITGASVPANTGCKRRYLVKAGTYTGQALAASDCTFEDGSNYDRFVLYSKSPCSVTVSNTQFTTWVFVYDEIANAFLDGRGGDDVGATEHLGFPSCQYLGHPLAVLVNDYPDEAGAYTMTITLTGVATLRASDSPSAAGADGEIPRDVARRISQMKAAARRNR